MQTITWRDADFTVEPGTIRTSRYDVAVEKEHVERWRDDPDGRFLVVPPAHERAPARLEKFYPSL
ncbi:hypothetical protein [Aureimonas sp. Leaf454]|uniref:hypothetical protein n=1 Tax=Aureimonas sp. Leaf454 TaxID=1736381 RepID=UPI000AC9A9F4|nr:hypothetical protein [Aureimonas sp. Leaf454]